jgi:hypothetical protein
MNKEDLVFNETLIANAELLAKGNNVHAINEAVTNYESWYKVATGTAWWERNPSEDRKSDAVIQVKEWERYIKKLIDGTAKKYDKPIVII